VKVIIAQNDSFFPGISDVCIDTLDFNVVVENLESMHDQVLKYVESEYKMTKMPEGKMAVLVLNDDTHSFDQVIYQIRVASGVDFQKAEMLTWKAHLSGEATIIESTNWNEIEKTIKILSDINLKSKIRWLSTDALNVIESDFKKNRTLVHEISANSPQASITSSTQQPEQYAVLLFRGDYDSNQLAEDLSRILGVDPYRAVHLEIQVEICGAAVLLKGTQEEARECYDQFNGKLYNVVLKSVSEILEEYASSEEDEET
jgi:ATP-dependent Clp protease adaptor protein ClpS